METAKAFKLGCRAPTLPDAWDMDKKTISYPKQMAIMLPWFNRDGSLVAAKYRFLETHEYTDKEGKPRKESKKAEYRSDLTGVFGWQAVKGPTQNHVLIITEGEMNAPSLWQAGGGLVDVLSSGSESTMETLPDDIIEFAKQYPYRIIWADKESVADNTAIRINASFSMQSPNGQDANDLLKAGKLEKLLKAMLKRIGATIDTPVIAPVVEASPILPSAVEAPAPATAPPADDASEVPAEEWAPDEPEIIHAGLTWRDAERLHGELKASVPMRMYGIGADPAQPGAYRIVKRSY